MGADPLRRLPRLLRAPVRTEPRLIETDTALVRDFARAIVVGDGRLTELIALDAMAGGLTLEGLYADVMTPALREVGDCWARGEMSVADEHLATEIVGGLMALVGRSETRLPRRSRERVLLAAAVPLETLGDAVARHEPRVVGLSTSVASPPERVRAAIRLVTERFPDVGVLVGGSGAPDDLPDGVAYASDARSALARIEALVR